MDDYPTLRAEIKKWEHSFLEQHGRKATPDDIRRQPDIATKYKLYKKLTKSASSKDDTKKQSALVPPSTPPRRTSTKDTTHTLLARTPAVAPTAPLLGYNPFSPQKKGQRKDGKPDSDLFGTPKKLPLFSSTTIASPESSLPFRPSSSTPPPTSPPPAEPSTAVSRARKRLRGEPVSPSPQKDKRRRVHTQTTLGFSRSRMETSGSEDEENDEDQGGDSSFIDNSPVKPAKGRSFSLLFEENPLPVANLFGVGPADPQGSTSSQKGNTNNDRKISKPKAMVAQTKLPFKRPVSVESTSREGSSAPLSPAPSATSSGVSAPSLSVGRSSQKRPWSDEDETSPMDEDAPRPKSPFLPPSPPPNPPGHAARAKSKGKSVAKGRKKVKMDGQDDSSDESEAPKLKITNRFKPRLPRAEGLDEEAIDPELDLLYGYARSTLPHVPATLDDDSTQDEAALVADLPDKLRDVLALPSSKSRSRDVELRVKGLLYGRRVTHYDPTKGGEIWDVGENDELMDGGHNHTEGEDDWEAEPIPWEVGEL